MRRLRILTYLSVLLAGLVYWEAYQVPATVRAGKGLVVAKAWLTNSAAVVTPAAHRRPADQTFLTFPEWYLVFAPEEQAEFFREHTSTRFPFMVHVAQIWGGYGAVYDQIRGNFPFNTGYHVMIVVISTSSTAEFGLKAVYENVIGRLTDLPEGVGMTAEDQFNAQLANDYVVFIKDHPWYEFDFKSRLRRFWGETPWVGAHMVRKLERRYILTTELVVKTVYGWLIGLGTRTAYDRPELTTEVVVEKLGALPAGGAEVKVLQRLEDGAALVELPRYDLFNPNICRLAASGMNFREVAGNESAILLTLLVPREWAPESKDYQVVFTQSLPSRPGARRVALVTPVGRLGGTIRGLLKEKQTRIEHVFDY